MGLTYNATTHSYTLGLVLLSVTAVAALVFTLALSRKSADRGQHRPGYEERDREDIKLSREWHRRRQ